MTLTEMDEAKKKVEGKPMPMALPVPMPEDLLKTYDWVIDHFMYDGTFCIAGTQGVGKTSTLMPLALVAAGAVEFDGIKATVKRDVVYVAEDVDQCWRIIYGVVKECGADEEIIKDHVSVLQAHRKNINEHEDIRNYAMTRYREHECPNGLVQVAPLVVLDTASANIDLSNTSDNSEVASAVAGARRIYRGFPLWISTHISKALKRADVKEMSVIGAIAWEADTQGAFYMFEDEDSGSRYLYGGAGVKRRDHGSVTEICIAGSSHNEIRTDRYGYVQDVPYMSVELSVSSETERIRKKEEAKALESGRKEDVARMWLTEEIKRRDVNREQDPTNKRGYPTKEALRQEGKKAGITRDAVDSAIAGRDEAGVIEYITMSSEERELLGRSNRGKAGYYISV